MYKYLFIFLLATSFAQVSDYAYMGAEATALAGANVSQRGGSESIYHNPAGIAEINTIRFYAGGGNLYGFNWLTAYHMSGIIPITGIGHIGFSKEIKVDSMPNSVSPPSTNPSIFPLKSSRT